MQAQAPLPLADVDMQAELHLTVHHLCGMLRTIKRINPNGPGAAVSSALEKHLKALTPAALGLPETWEVHAERIEAKALADAQAEGLTGPDAHRRSA